MIGAEKFTPENKGLILDSLRKGRTKSLAARLVGTQPQMLNTWLSKGRKNLDEIDRYASGQWSDGDPPPTLNGYGEFFVQVLVAQAQAEDDRARVFCDSSLMDPQWALTWLRQADPEHYRRDVTPVEVSGPGGREIQIDVVSLLQSRISETIAAAEKAEAAAKPGS
jgi:hypothetical protein